MGRISLPIAALALLFPFTPTMGQALKKAYITVISETGFPHSAVLLEYPDKQVWLGFKPVVPKVPVGKGKLDESDRSKEVDKWVRFEVDSKKLEEVEKIVRKEFDEKEYKAGVFDCVNLSVAFAKGVELKVPDAPNLIPGNLVDKLDKMNADRKPTTGNGKDSLPWQKK